MAKTIILQTGICRCIRVPVGKAKSILGDDKFDLHGKYPFKRLYIPDQTHPIMYEIGHNSCDAVIFKSHFIITKSITINEEPS